MGGESRAPQALASLPGKCSCRGVWRDRVQSTRSRRWGLGIGARYLETSGSGNFWPQSIAVSLPQITFSSPATVRGACCPSAMTPQKCCRNFRLRRALRAHCLLSQLQQPPGMGQRWSSQQRANPRHRAARSGRHGRVRGCKVPRAALPGPHSMTGGARPGTDLACDLVTRGTGFPECTNASEWSLKASPRCVPGDPMGACLWVRTPAPVVLGRPEVKSASTPAAAVHCSLPEAPKIGSWPGSHEGLTAAVLGKGLPFWGLKAGEQTGLPRP